MMTGNNPSTEIFRLNGNPIPIHLHGSLSGGGFRAIAKKIKDAGGDPSATEAKARVIICRYGTPIFTELELFYDHDRYKWVEPPSWVDTCLDLGKYAHYLPSQMSKMETWRNIRTPFSAEDDENLVTFLALRIPYKELGGRQGNGVYKDLCSDLRSSLYPWATRHTWQSWRERYIKNQDVFDSRIAHAVKHDKDPPEPGGKGQYVIPRKRQRPQPLRHIVEEEISDSDDFEQERQEEPLQQEPRRLKRQQQQQQQQEEEEEEEEEEGVEDVAYTSAVNAKKRSRQETDLRHDRNEGSRQNTSPPRKHRRLLNASSNHGDDAFDGILQDKGKGKGRQVPSEPEFELQEHLDVEDPDSPIRSAESTMTIRQDPQPMASAPRQVSDVYGSEPQATAAPQMPLDTQVTLVSPSSPPPPLLNTERTQRAARKGASRGPTQQQPVSRNTRSRRLPQDKFLKLGSNTPPPAVSEVERPAGRRRKFQQPIVSPQKQSQTFTSAVASASVREEVQVEEILQVSEEVNNSQVAGEAEQGDESSSTESLSPDDDEAMRLLRNANEWLINQPTRVRSKSRSITDTPNLRGVRHIDVPRETGGNNRKQSAVRATSVKAFRADPDPDPEAIPRAKVGAIRKAAKKTATREPSSSELHDSESDMQSGTRTDMTGSSFPVETTNARDYINAQSPYTPAPGTMAEAHMRGKTSKTREGSRRTR